MIRVYELAKQLGKSNKEVMTILESLGLSLKSHSSSVDDFYAQKVKEKTQTSVAPPKPKGLQIFGVVKKHEVDALVQAKAEADAQVVASTPVAVSSTDAVTPVKPTPLTTLVAARSNAPAPVVTPPVAAPPSPASAPVAPPAPPARENAAADSKAAASAKRPAVSKLDLIRKLDSVERRERMRRQKEIKDSGGTEELPGFKLGGLGTAAPPMGRMRRRSRKRKGHSTESNELQTPDTLSEDQYKTRPVRQVEFLGTSVQIKDLATLIDLPLAVLMKEFLMRGMFLNLNSPVDLNMAKDIAKVYSVELITDVKKETREEKARRVVDEHEYGLIDSNQELKLRPPVVTVMGHVDHGKTKLLDKIRSANVVASEAGGITQHIGAYQVVVKNRKITFLDTPGHEAFTTLRARGAQVTDIVILVVAADDGMMPQTLEALNHARAARVPIIVAINKIDKPSANIDNVKQQLAQHDLASEDWGGKTVVVPVSAINGQGVDELLDMILLTSDLLDLHASYQGHAKGVVIEAKLSSQRGPVATVLIKTGTLKVGDPFVIGSVYGRVRAMLNERGDAQNEATPSAPVELLGLNGVPQAGDLLEVVSDDRQARQIAETRSESEQSEGAHKVTSVSLELLSRQIKEGKTKDLNLVIKADVRGSLEAIQASLGKLNTEVVSLNTILHATGPVTESDIMLAKASHAIVQAFRVPVPTQVAKLAADEGIEIKIYDIIYEMIDDIKLTMEGMLEIEYQDVESGRAEVRQVFEFSRVGKIAGCMVISGRLQRGQNLRILRGDKVVLESVLDSLKRFKEDVREVKEGFECGLVISKYSDPQAGDVVISHEKVEKKRQPAPRSSQPVAA